MKRLDTRSFDPSSYREYTPGKPVAHNFGLLHLDSGLLRSLVAHSFELRPLFLM